MSVSKLAVYICDSAPSDITVLVRNGVEPRLLLGDMELLTARGVTRTEALKPENVFQQNTNICVLISVGSTHEIS